MTTRTRVTRPLLRPAVLGLLGLFGLLCTVPSPPGAGPARAASDETPKDIIADQIRRQGYACGTAKDAKRDSAHSKPDEAAWVLTCDDATYSVILIPDMAARVKRLD